LDNAMLSIRRLSIQGAHLITCAGRRGASRAAMEQLLCAAQQQIFCPADGWYPRSAGNKVILVTPRSVRIARLFCTTCPWRQPRRARRRATGAA